MTTQTHKWLPSEPTYDMRYAAILAASMEEDVYLPELSVIDFLYKAMWKAAPEISQEPVAYLQKNRQGALYTHPQPIRNLALIWAQGYRAGISDERESEANVGIAGGDYKVEPNRNNPYENIYPQPKQFEQVELKRDPLSEDQIREICSKVSKESGFDLSPATFVLAFRAAEKEHRI
jgi:hypothetical protein